MRLREITRDEDDMCAASSTARGAFSCPICLHPVGGDEDEKSAHVDACLTFEAERSRAQEIGAREGTLNGSAEAEVERITNEMSFRGMFLCNLPTWDVAFIHLEQALAFTYVTETLKT